MENKNKSVENYRITKKQIYYGLGAFAIIILAVFSYIYFSDNLIEKKVVVATVNGEEITSDQVTKVKSALELQNGGAINESLVLEQLVSRELLIQEADKKSINSTRQEAEELLSLQAAQQGRSLEDIKKLLQESGANYEDIIEGYMDEIKIRKLTEEVLSEQEDLVSEEEITNFFNDNEKLFAQINATAKLEDYHDQIELLLSQQKQQGVLKEYIDNLKENAEITYY